MRNNSIKNQVEKILQTNIQSRNSDITLMIELWKTYYSDLLMNKKDTDEYAVNLRMLFTLPPQDNIKRYRAFFQNNEGKYLPTSLKVAKQRRIKENVWRSEMKIHKPVESYQHKD